MPDETAGFISSPVGFAFLIMMQASASRITSRSATMLPAIPTPDRPSQFIALQVTENPQSVANYEQEISAEREILRPSAQSAHPDCYSPMVTHSFPVPSCPQ
jgi:hypothetical protein